MVFASDTDAPGKQLRWTAIAAMHRRQRSRRHSSMTTLPLLITANIVTSCSLSFENSDFVACCINVTNRGLECAARLTLICVMTPGQSSSTVVFSRFRYFRAIRKYWTWAHLFQIMFICRCITGSADNLLVRANEDEVIAHQPIPYPYWPDSTNGYFYHLHHPNRKGSIWMMCELISSLEIGWSPSNEQ